MIKLYDQNHNAIGHIVKYKNCKIESELSTGDKTLSFTYLAKHHKIQNEYYIRTKDEEYVIKEVPSSSSGFPEIVAVLNLEDLQKDMWQTFSVKDATIDEAARTVLAGTGWTIGNCDVTKRRNAGMMQVSTLEVLQKLCAAFMCDPVFDTINKRVSFYEKRGQDKGVYFMSGLNLKKIKKSSRSYDFYTRIIPIGQDGLTIEKVNGGKNYLENYEYSNKILTYIWKDESYTDAQALKEDAELKLKDLAKPEVSFSADVRDLAKQKPGYSILSYNLGDTVTLIDRESGIREKQRIVKMVEYPKEPEKNTCELANTFLTFTQMQEKYQAAADIINFTVAGDGRYTGKINVSDILNFESGLSGSATMGGILGNIETMEGEIGKVKIRVGTIEANYLKVEEADLKYATIENLNATNGTITNLKGEYAEFKTVITEEISAQKGMIDTITGDLADYKKVVTEELVTAKGWMASGSIGDAQISSLSANKVTAGTIDAAIVTIAGTDGRLQISDNTIQIKDTDRVRVQMGKDASGDYSLSVWDSQGNLIWDALGATEKTIQRKIIRDSVVADDAAIQALKVDFRSFDTALTEQGVTISGTVIQVGSKNLNVALSEHTQSIQDVTIQLAGTKETIKAQQENIKDHETRITANEKGISLKVSTQEFESYKTAAEGETKAIKEVLTTTSQEISALKGEIALKVEQVDIETYVDTELKSYSTTEQMNAAIELSKNSIVSEVSKTYSTKTELGAVTEDVSILKSKSEQTEEKFSWIVKSGTSETNFLITDRLAQLTASYINLNGSITLGGIDPEVLEALSNGGLTITEEDPIIALTNDNQVMQTDGGENTHVEAVKILQFASQDGADGWGVFYGRRIAIPKFQVNLSADVFKNTDGYILQRIGGERYVVWMENNTWRGQLADGTGEEITWNWQNNTDAIMAFYSKKNAGMVSYELYGPMKSYQEIKMSAMVANWAAGAIDEFTMINGGLIMTNTIVTDALGAGIVTAEKISAGAITTDKIATGAVTAAKINVEELFSQNIEATNLHIKGTSTFEGRLNGATGSFSGRVTASEGNIAGWLLTENAIYRGNSTMGNAAGMYFGVNGLSVKDQFQVNTDGKLISKNADIKGVINATEAIIKRSLYLYDDDMPVGAEYTEALGIEGVLEQILRIGGGFNRIAIGNNSEIEIIGNFIGDVVFDKIKIKALDNASSRYAICTGAQNYYTSRIWGSNTTTLAVMGQWGTETYMQKNITINSSDIRLKNNVKYTQIKALEEIKQIKVREFDWIDTGEKQRIGFVADELELIDPKMAIGGGYTEDGSMNVKSVDVFYLMGYVVKSIQELCQKEEVSDAKIGFAEYRISKTEENIFELKNELGKVKKQLQNALEQIKELKQLKQCIA